MRPYGSRLVSPDTRKRISRHARGALVAADALGEIPTPLDQVTAALKLGSPESLLEIDDGPGWLKGFARRLRGKVLGAFSFRERIIYLDRDQPGERERFAHAHELGHDALPWHRDAYYADDQYTLRSDTHFLLEAEANCFAADLLFQLDRFREEASSYGLGLAVPLEFAARYETSRHAAIRRYVEDHVRPCALLELGRFPVHPEGRKSLKVLNTIDSPSFIERLGPVSDLLPKSLPLEDSDLATDAFRALTRPSLNPITTGTLRIDGSAHGSIQLEYEVFSNTYGVFALVYPRRRIKVRRQVRAEWKEGGAA